jgi:hypothetical protein
MKGFIYLLEIVIASILITSVVSFFFITEIKQDWERSDLISIGNGIINSLRDEDVYELLNGNFSKVEKLIPDNVDFNIKIEGIAKSNITVGCVNYCDYIETLLTPVYMNGRWINFTVYQFDLSGGIPNYDVIVLVNYTEYSTYKNVILNYLNNGGILIGINATFNNNDPDFNEIFGLIAGMPAGSDDFHFFEPYNPLTEDIEKYFLGLGFDIATENSINSKRWGYWYIWEESRKVNITATTVDVENKTVDEGLIKNIPEGGIFRLKNPVDNEFYTFKVRKIWWPKKVDIQLLNTTFHFKDFSEFNDVRANVRGVDVIINIPPTPIEIRAEMISNNSAIWISDFPWSDEYRSLIKAAIASRVNSWFPKRIKTTKKVTTVSKMVSLCCDMPETGEIIFILWYKI